MKNETTNDKNRPAHEIRYGGIKAVIWRNATSNGVMHNVTLARLYKDGDEWRETSGFNSEYPLCSRIYINKTFFSIHKPNTFTLVFDDQAVFFLTFF